MIIISLIIIDNAITILIFMSSMLHFQTFKSSNFWQNTGEMLQTRK